MKKILIIQNKILHYRKALYNELSKTYDVTVLHSGTISVINGDRYKEIITVSQKIGSFYIQHKVLSEVRKDYDVIIAMFDLHWLNSFLVPVVKTRKAQFIWWGQWLTDKKVVDCLKIYLSNKKYKSIIYTHPEKDKLIKNGVKNENLFVANNTFDVGVRIKSFENNNKASILFVGSLDSRKQNDVLINAFNNILHKIPEYIQLTIIGDGAENAKLKSLVQALGIGDRVVFAGRIEKNLTLKKFYEKAIVSVSFGQAGLSVLQSLGYGVPFITKWNSISGGEKSNIIDGYNGFLCDDSQEALEESLLKVINNNDLSKLMGENAYQYYSEKCTIQIMSTGFIKAIKST